MNQLHKAIIWDWSERLFWALAGVILFAFALSFTYNDPEPILLVKDSDVSKCLPDNDRTISLMRLRLNSNGTSHLVCEKHESMGYGKMPTRPVRIQVAISER